MMQNDEQIYETVVMDVDAIGEGCWKVAFWETQFEVRRD